MPASIITVELHLPGARSLKDKRRIVNSLRDKIHSRYRVSIAETQLHDLHQRCQLGIASVAADGSHLEDLVASIRRLFDARFEIQVTSWNEQLVALEGLGATLGMEG